MAVSPGELYNAESPIYVRGPAATAPPPAGSYDGGDLPPRPHPDRVRELTLDISNLETEIRRARQEIGQAQLDIATLAEKREADAETLEGQAEAAELNELRAERRIMAEQLPPERVQRLAALEEKLETAPDRQLSTLRFEESRHQGMIIQREAELAAGRQQQARQAEIEQLHQDAEVRAAAQRRHWGVETPADIKRLTEAKVDLDQIPRRQQPSR